MAVAVDRELAVVLALLVPATGFVVPAAGFVVAVAGFVTGGRVVAVAGFTAGFAVAVLAPAVDLAGVTGGLGVAAARLAAPAEVEDDGAGDRTAIRAFARDEAVAPAGVLGRDKLPAGVFGRDAPLAVVLSVDAFGTGGRRVRAGVDPDPDAVD